MTRMLALGLLLAAPLTADAATWQIDAAHSRAGFSVRHMMVSWVKGYFGDLSGTVEYDPANPTATTADVTIQVTSINTGNDDRDAHLRNEDFFHVEAYPTMTFVGKSVRNATESGFELVGDLTIRGVTKEVVLDVTDLTPEVTDPWGNVKMGGSASTTINRQDFGVSYNSTLDQGGLLVGDNVKIEIDVELNKVAEPEPEPEGKKKKGKK